VYNIAKDLGPGAACLYDYCNCGGVAVPLLSTTISETATVDCGGYTIQPTAKKCPTGPPASVSNSPAATAGVSNPPASTVPLPSGAAVVTGVVGNQTTVETFVLTSFTQYATVTVSITTTVLDARSSPVTVVIGPSGVAWAPFSHASSLPNVPAPSVPSAPSGSSSAVVPPPGSSVPLPSGGTVVIGSVESQVATETFMTTIISGYTTLVTTTTNVISSSVTEAIGPGGIVWIPLSQPPSGAPELPPPSVLPSNPSAPPPSGLPSSTLPSGVPSVTEASVQSSVKDAFDHVSQSQTSLIINGVTEYYSKETFSDLATITAPTTVTTPIVQTKDDGSQFTVSAGIIIVGPGGTWWNGGTGGLGLHGPLCIWPFCPPGGGGEVIGGGFKSSPKDNNTPGSNEESNNPNSPSNSHFSSSASSTFCSSTAVASDCSVLCSSTQSGASTSQPCSTTCYSTITGCSPTGMTVTATTSTATAQLCSLDCSSCKVNKIPAATHAAAKRDVNDRRDGLEVRRLNEPSDPQYGGNVEAFLLTEYIWAEWVPIQGNGSSALARQLGNQRKDLAVHGLHGCTSVIVVSNQGIWISHFWEDQAFRTQALFQIDVLNQMRNGDGTPEMPGILQYTSPGGQFEGLQKPQAIIVTPQVRGSQIPGDLLYRSMVDQIKVSLLQMMPSSNPIVIDYQPDSESNAQLTTYTGKILVQYDPAQGFLSNPNNRCQTGQQAMIRIWVENRPLVYQLYWLAERNQRVQQPQKRDAACTLPLSTLPQTVTAATESQGSAMGTLVPSASLSPSSASTSSSANAITTFPPTTSAPSSSASSGSCPSASPTAGAPQVPGCWGIPACAYYIAADQGLPPDTPNYCNCGGTTAPLLTHGGKTDCAYPTQLASNIPLGTLTGVLASTSNPPTSSSSNIPPTAPSPPYATGRCNIHVWEGLEQQAGQNVYLDVNITDANGAVIGFGHDGIQWAKSLNVDSKLANVMVLTPQTGYKNKIKRATDPLFGADAENSRRSYPLRKWVIAPPSTRPLYEKGPLNFAVGGQSWDTTSSQCSVGNYENGNANDFFSSFFFGDKFVPRRQMDCKFDC